MSYGYDLYLEKHRRNVKSGFYWFRDNLPELIIGVPDIEHQLVFAHDRSKNDDAEYNAYDAYFYGGNQSYAVVKEYERAWLSHIHNNPHHWQYWILNTDNPDEGEVLIEMEYIYIIEMICDWWSFSWKEGALDEIFTWYDKRKAYIRLHPSTRATLESILGKMKTRLEELR